MDENIKIYTRRNQMNLPMLSYEETMEQMQKYDENIKQSSNSKWKYFFDKKIWKLVLEENYKREYELNQKYPWFEILHRWFIVLLIGLLFASFIIWGINVYTERTAQAYAAEQVEQKEAEHQAFLAQMEADKQAELESIENVMKSNAKVKAKLGYGSRNFVEKYHYGDADFMTLYQCVDNRLRNSMYSGMTIEEIVFQKDQFIASYDTNPSEDYYYNLALKSERLKHERELDGRPEPVGSDFVYTIYTPHGIFLANDPKAPAYTWWHYSE